MPTNSLRLAWACVALGTVLASPSAQAASPKLESSDVMIPSADAGIELFVRNKHPAGTESFPSDCTCTAQRTRRKPLSTYLSRVCR